MEHHDQHGGTATTRRGSGTGSAVAAGALAWAGIVLAPAVGAILMSLPTIVVALNAQLLRSLDLQHR